MAPHSSTLGWKIPWTEEPGGLLSMGSHRVGHDWSDLAAAAAAAIVNDTLIFISIFNSSLLEYRNTVIFVSDFVFCNLAELI